MYDSSRTSEFKELISEIIASKEEAKSISMKRMSEKRTGHLQGIHGWLNVHHVRIL